MHPLEAILLGFIQGVTEFLPVSSSGHLVIFKQWLSLTTPSLFFEVFLHAATLLAIIVYFWHDIVKISRDELKLVLIGSLPIGVVGFLFKERVELLFNSTLLVGLMLLITGTVNLLTDKELDKRDEKGKDEAENEAEQLTFKKALIIGFIQVAAILPGISRSGSTVFGSIVQKVSREDAFRFSFFLALPAITGATLYEMIGVDWAAVERLGYYKLILGGAMAFITGLGSLKLLHYMIKEASFQWFAWYCFILGGGVLALELLRVV